MVTLTRSPQEFIDRLRRTQTDLLTRLEPAATLRPDDPKLDLKMLLKAALRNELEAVEIAARWIPRTGDPELKLALARQVGDEARHYRLIQERLRELGEDLNGFNPLAQGFSPLFQYLDGLQESVEQVAAGQFTREAIALVKNTQFIAHCLALGDQKTAALYRDTINVDERSHHELGERILERLAVTAEAQDQAQAAMERTLQLAEELTSLALDRHGIHHAPGC
jgi:1,2-phenylacetyl-CoA epoxidase catalytic subunit